MRSAPNWKTPAIRVHFGTREECEQRRVKAFIAVATTRPATASSSSSKPYHSGTRYFPGRDAGVTEFSHIGLYTTDAPRDEKFWTRLCNARVSDWIGDAALLRIDTAHHSLALFPAPRPGIQHINHQVEDVDDVMKSWYFLRDKGVKILLGPGRHPLSTAVMLYFRGPDGMTLRIFLRREAHHAGARGDLSPAAVPVRALCGVHVGFDARSGNLRLPARRDSCQADAAAGRDVLSRALHRHGRF